MNSSFLQKSQLHNASFNSSFNSSVVGLNYSRRGGGGRGDGTVLMSTGLTQSLEPYGTPLPAMVKVAISSCNASGDGTKFSCRLDPNGWGWLVTGRKLYVWRHTPEIGKKSAISCRELVLPPSELVHHAKLVAVLPSSTTTAPAVLALSPEGHITYWPNISNESNTVTLNADIPGQECDSLTSIWPVGCIVTTTTSTVLLIKASSGRGNKPGLSCSMLVAQKSWLGGWSKKMSTMLFTAVPPAPSGLDNKRARVVVPMSKDDDPVSPGNNKEGKVYIFQGSAVQTWQFSGDAHLCSSEINIEEHLRRQFVQNVWNIDEDSSDSSRASAIQTWILDIASLPHSKQLAVFVAAKSGWETSDNLVYGIVTFDVKRYRQQDAWTFIPVICNITNTGLEDDHLSAWKLLTTQSHYFVISNECILTAVAENDGSTDAIESGTLGGPIIGAGNVAWNSVVVLVPRWGLLTIKPALVQDCLGLDETFSDVRVPDHLALSMTQAYITDLDENEDTLARYKSAFLLFLQKKMDDCGDLLNDLFPLNEPLGHSPAPSSIDTATLSIVERLIDEAPSADPRWGTAFRNDEQDVGIKSKILIKNFLVDKRESVELFVSFLSNMGIWSRLEGITVKEDVIATSSLLYNAYEKVYFALTLQNMQNEPQFRKILDTAIRSIVMMRKEKDCQVRSSHLSPNDLFYKQVSRVHQIIPALVSIQEEEFQTLSSLDLPARVLLTNEVLLRSLLEVYAVATGPGEKLYQIQDFLIKPLMTSEDNEYQVQPWIIEANILRSLMKQHELIVSSGICNIEIETGLKLELLKQLQQFTDIILDALKSNLTSIQHSERYPIKLQNFETIRSKLLRTHLQVKDYDGGALLAEKYLDFEILATICYDKKDLRCLTEYFHKYDGMNFPEFTWEWYVRQGKAGELVDTFSKSQFKNRLGVFLRKYPNIAWHHATINDQFGNAADVLKGLAFKEEALADDKKFLLCMSKLAALANTDAREEDRNDFVSDVDRNLRLLEFQTRIPDDVLNVYGMEKESMRVLNPSEMIDMYTTAEVHFEADNFTNALGLAEFMINEDLQMEKRVLITYRAIQRDPWKSWTKPDHPMDVVSDTALFHFLVAAINNGWTLDEVYPISTLFSFPDMKNLVENPNVKFLLRACHEHFVTTLADMQSSSADYDME